MTITNPNLEIQSISPPARVLRRAKIICTLGPATASLAKIDELMAAGMDCARLNFSHGDHKSHAQSIAWVREASTRRNRAVSIIADLQGPKIRVGDIPGGKMDLQTGGTVVLAAGGAENAPAGSIRTTYAHLADDVSPGDTIRLDDGRIALRVTRVCGKLVECEIYTGGVLLPNKGMNLPGVALRIASLTEKDRADLAFAVGAGVDYVALSFVRKPEDILECRQLMGERVVPIIAKLERPEAVDQLEAIMDVADGVMVARGDLGVEFPPQRVPVIQKQVMRMAARKRVPVIVATEMLNSMISSPRPTRAEASDVATAVFDGADALMLSGETASGDYPIRSVVFMDRIIREAESARGLDPMVAPDPSREPPEAHVASIPETAARIACLAARESGARLIAAFTKSGTTARLISRERPPVPIIAFSAIEQVRRRVGLYWGVTPMVLEPFKDLDQVVAAVEDHLITAGFVVPGDRVVIVVGAPLHVPGHTNTVRVHQIAT